MIAPLNSRYLPATHAALRIVAGLTYFSHGGAKLFGWFGGMGPNGGTVDLMSRFGAAGVIEVVVGACLILGLATRLAAGSGGGRIMVKWSFCIPSSGWFLRHGEPVRSASTDGLLNGRVLPNPTLPGRPSVIARKPEGPTK